MYCAMQKIASDGQLRRRSQRGDSYFYCFGLRLE